MDALCEDGLLPTSEQDDLVRIFHESSGLSELEARFCDGRSAPSPMAAGAAQFRWSSLKVSLAADDARVRSAAPQARGVECSAGSAALARDHSAGGNDLGGNFDGCQVGLRGTARSEVEAPDDENADSAETVRRDLDRIFITGGVDALVGNTYGAAKRCRCLRHR